MSHSEARYLASGGLRPPRLTLFTTACRTDRLPLSIGLKRRAGRRILRSSVSWGDLKPAKGIHLLLHAVARFTEKDGSRSPGSLSLATVR